MKTFVSLITLVLLVSSTSFAEIRSEMKKLSKVEYDGRNLKIEYRMSGGCEKHNGEIQLHYDKKTKTVRMEVYDITAKPDTCEAYISGSVAVDLKAEVADLLKKEGLNAGTAWQVTVQLPEVTLYPFEP